MITGAVLIVVVRMLWPNSSLCPPGKPSITLFSPSAISEKEGTFAQEFTRELNTDLSKHPWLCVVPSENAISKQTTLKPEDLGKELEVHYVLSVTGGEEKKLVKVEISVQKVQEFPVPKTWPLQGSSREEVRKRIVKEIKKEIEKKQT